MHLMCLLSGKVKIYKEGVGGRSQIIRVLKTKEYFAYRAFLPKELRDSCFRFRALHYLPYSHAGHYETDKDNSELALFFIRQLSIDLGISDERTVNLTQNIFVDDWRNLCYF